MTNLKPLIDNPFSLTSMVFQSSTQSSLLDQYLNPYFLHHSNSTNLILVLDLLMSWSHAMILGLTIENKLGFVDGTLPRQDGDTKNSWIICNSVVTTWLLNSLLKEISTSVSISDSARDIWLDLQQRYQRKNRPRLFQLRCEYQILLNINCLLRPILQK